MEGGFILTKLNISHTSISVSNLDTLVEGNVNSIFVEFVFSAEWENLARVAVFSNGSAKVAVSLDSDICAIPWEVLSTTGELCISIRGIGESGSFVLCTENKLLGKIVPSLAGDDLADPQVYTPQVMDTLLADMEEIQTAGGVSGPAGKSAYEIAVENGFDGTAVEWLASLKGADGADGANGADGADGVNGTDGADGADGYTPVKGADYFTSADIAEIVEAVIDTLPDGDEVSY